MTDKIIIDGIDVSNCDFFIDWYEVNESKFQDVPFEKVTDLPKHLNGVPLYYLRKNLCDGYSCYCKENPNCYYKQLKRKEQECEKFLQTLTEIKEIAEYQIKAEENNKYKTNGYIVALDILQKISEVNNDR